MHRLAVLSDGKGCKMKTYVRLANCHDAFEVVNSRGNLVGLVPQSFFNKDYNPKHVPSLVGSVHIGLDYVEIAKADETEWQVLRQFWKD